MAGRVAAPGADEEAALTIFVDGQPCEAHAGETVAAALYASGRRSWRRSRPGPGMRAGEPRGLLCGMGVCFDCLVRVDGAPGQRACQTLVREGMRIDTDAVESEAA